MFAAIKRFVTTVASTLRRHFKLNPLLIEAARNRNMNAIMDLLEQGADVNAATFWENDTALGIAADLGDAVLVQRLLLRGADANYQNRAGSTALMRASYKGFTGIVQQLLDHGADINAQDRQGFSALIFASEQSQTETMQCLIGAGARVDAVTLTGVSALMYASRAANQIAVQALLEAHANVHLQTDRGVTALICAAFGGCLAIVEQLVAAGADIQHHADGANGVNALISAAAKGHEAIVHYLLQRGVPVNMRATPNHWPALFYACQKGHFNVVNLLLAQGADPTEAIPRPLLGGLVTPVELAYEHMHFGIVQQLMDAGVPPPPQADIIVSHAVGSGAEAIQRRCDAYSAAGGDIDHLMDSLPAELHYFKCPITDSLMLDPVIASDGHAYERHAIATWVSLKSTSPCTREAITNVFYPSQLHRQQIINYLEVKTQQLLRAARNDARSSQMALTSRPLIGSPSAMDIAWQQSEQKEPARAASPSRLGIFGVSIDVSDTYQALEEKQPSCSPKHRS